MKYDRTCFVIMPFGKKKVEFPRKRPTVKGRAVSKTIDFDRIYGEIFEPAINAVQLPEGGTLIAKRTDKDFFAGSISYEMFRYIEYSRFALADITGLRANVFYELGARHRARESGTAIFRIVDAPIPFDINTIKAFPYAYSPTTQVAQSQALVMRVLSDSLQYNRLDSPIRQALEMQAHSTENIDELLRQAEEAVRNQDWRNASQKFEAAAQRQPANPLVRFSIGLMRRNQGNWQEAIAEFLQVIKHSPKYAEGYRELGIAENKRYHRTSHNPPDGISSLQKAVLLKPVDYDALSSLGGALRRAGRLDEALDAYRRATRVSLGHPYPLLNELKLEAVVEQKQVPGVGHLLRLRRAEAFRQRQVDHTPPLDVPWSYFDLAEIRLYLQKPGEFLRLIDCGLLQCAHRWQAETFRETLTWFARALTEQAVPLPDGLEQGIETLAAAELELPE